MIFPQEDFIAFVSGYRIMHLQSQKNFPFCLEIEIEYRLRSDRRQFTTTANEAMKIDNVQTEK